MSSQNIFFGVWQIGTDRQPLLLQQFDSAYNYVARIKQRFINQPEVYKQFLIILQRCGLLLLLDVCLKSAVMGHVFRNPRASYFSVFFVHVTVLQPSFVVHVRQVAFRA